MLARSGGARTPAFAPGTGVRRRKMTVRWMVIPSNGLATDGEPRAFERRRESGSEEGPLRGPSETRAERGRPAWEVRMRGSGRSCASLHSRHRCLPARKSGVPFLSVPCFGHTKKGGRRTGVGAPGKGKRPVNACPGERACHGRQAQDLQARARRAERSKPGSTQSPVGDLKTTYPFTTHGSRLTTLGPEASEEAYNLMHASSETLGTGGRIVRLRARQ